jgi:ribosomal protein S6
VYPIKKRTNGYYLGVRFKANTDLVQRLEKMYVLEEQILRYLTLAIDEKLLRARAASIQRMELRQKEAAAAAEAAIASGIPLPPPERQQRDRNYSR